VHDYGLDNLHLRLLLDANRLCSVLPRFRAVSGSSRGIGLMPLLRCSSEASRPLRHGSMVGSAGLANWSQQLLGGRQQYEQHRSPPAAGSASTGAAADACAAHTAAGSAAPPRQTASPQQQPAEPTAAVEAADDILTIRSQGVVHSSPEDAAQVGLADADAAQDAADTEAVAAAEASLTPRKRGRGGKAKEIAPRPTHFLAVPLHQVHCKCAVVPANAGTSIV